MSHRLPPLSAIQGFECAARHLSFRRAAEELHLTQSAVSHQVRALEDFLGVDLFERRANRIALTVEGRAYVDEIAGLLDRLRTSTARIRGEAAPETLTVCGTPAFMARWLGPRLWSFVEGHPEIELNLVTGLPPTDFAATGADVIFHWGDAPVAGVEIEPFLASRRLPVAAPAFRDRWGTPAGAADLLPMTLLHDVVDDGWAAWFRRAGIVAPGRLRGPRFEHCELALAAAERGQGVVLAYRELIGAELAEGRLVPMWQLETEPILIYSVAYPVRRADEPAILAFRNWVLGEAFGEGAVQPDLVHRLVAE